MTKEKLILDKGDKVEIQYGHPVFITKQEWEIIKRETPNYPINEKPKNIIYEDDDKFIVDSCPYLKGSKDTIAARINKDDSYEYELQDSPKIGWYTRNQLKLL